jgi:Effector Associated Constant Component 1
MSDLVLRIETEQGADDQELAQLAGKLRRELLHLDVDAVTHAGGGKPPPGAKAVGVVEVGGLIVHLLKSSTLLGAVVGAVQSWLSGHGGRSVKLELDGDVIEVTGVSSDQQRRLVDAWIARHALD